MLEPSASAKLGTRVRSWALIGVAVSLLSGLPADASQQEAVPDADGLSLSSEGLTVPSSPGSRMTSYGFWTWGAERLGYALTVENAQPMQWSHLSSIDLRSGEVIRKIAFPPDAPAWAGRPYNQPSVMRGMPLTITVDEVAGRLFIPYTTWVSSADVPGTAARPAGTVTGGTCTEWGSAPPAPCLAGFHIYDARTLEHLGRMPIRLVGLDSVLVWVKPQAVAYQPPSPGAPSGRLYALVESVPEEGTPSVTFRPRHIERARNFLIAFDPDGARQEWAHEVQECRAARETAPSDVYRKRQGAAAIIPTGDAVWIGCHGNSARAGVVVHVPLAPDGTPLPGAMPSVPSRPAPVADGQPAAEGESPALPAAVPAQHESFMGPELAAEVHADPGSKRFLFRTIAPNPHAEVWVVFDTARREYIGRIGTGGRADASTSSPATMLQGSSMVDPRTGRLYVYHPQEGLYVAEVRSDPLGQALFFPEFQGLYDKSTNDDLQYAPLVADDRPDGVTGVLVRTEETRYRIIEDERPQFTAAPPTEQRRTLDIDEQEGLTLSSVDGTARGYGARTLLIAGAEAAARIRFVDPVGWGKGHLPKARDLVVDTTDRLFVDPSARPLRKEQFSAVPWRDACSDEDREIVLGFVGPKESAVVDSGGARGAATPVVINGTTAEDLGAPVSRCVRQDWQQIWTAALFGNAPLEEPGMPPELFPAQAECTQGDDGEAQSSDSRGDPGADPFFAQVSCEDGQAAGFGYARGGAPGLRVAEALSSFRIYRDPHRGIVSRVESVARGIEIEGLVTIDTVRGVAESWANGRRQPVAEADRDAGYSPNCDIERTAGTCFKRHLFGVRTPSWRCGPCGDERAFVEGMRQAFAGDARIRLREPDQVLAAGSEDGYQAAVIKSVDERFSDLILNNDLVADVVPTLEIVRYAAPGRPGNFNDTYEARSGRQVYQFAGVQVSSTYAIECLAIYDETDGLCALAAPEPTELKVQLTDPDGKPLAGGGFEVREDADADGVLGLADKLVPEGACVTTDDGIGTCAFSTLKPGKYLVTQVVAPPPYAPTKEPFAVELVAGDSRTVVFTNTSSISTVNVKVEGEDGQPLSGASFAIYPDPDADGKVAADAKPAATCDTGAEGTCSMTVPAGSYVLVQTAAPGGLEAIEPVPFVLSSGGQVAAVNVVNYPPELPEAPQGTAAPTFVYQPPPAEQPPTLHTVPLPTMGIPQDQEPQIAPADGGAGFGGTVERIVRAPGDAVRLLARSPEEAVAFAAAVLLFALACLAVERRRRLTELTAANSR